MPVTMLATPPVHSEHFVRRGEHGCACRHEGHRAQARNILAAVALPADETAAKRGQQYLAYDFCLFRKIHNELAALDAARPL